MSRIDASTAHLLVLHVALLGWLSIMYPCMLQIRLTKAALHGQLTGA